MGEAKVYYRGAIITSRISSAISKLRNIPPDQGPKGYVSTLTPDKVRSAKSEIWPASSIEGLLEYCICIPRDTHAYNLRTKKIEGSLYLGEVSQEELAKE